VHSAFPQYSSFDILSLSVATFLAIVADLRPIAFSIGRESSRMSLAVVAFLPVLLTYGWAPAILVMLVAQVGTDLHAGKPWYKTMYNCASIGISIVLAERTYSAVTRGTSFIPALPFSLLGASVAGAVFFLVNTTFVALVIATAQNLRFWTTAMYNMTIMVPVSASRIALGIIATALWHIYPLLILPLLAPLLSTKRSYEGFVRLQTETDNFIIALADAIDMRDPYTAQHSSRVAALCRALGERLGMTGRTLKDFEAIARVHDVGKIAVPDAVLLKPGRLSETEFAQIKEHVDVGVKILGRVSLYTSSLDILHQHHERLDGSGYPRGLIGEQIGLPGRIIAVVDTYDAITTDRPYRQARSSLDAMHELYRAVGRHYDFGVVRALEDELLQRGVLSHPVLAANLAFDAPESIAQASVVTTTSHGSVIPFARVRPAARDTTTASPTSTR
jgi:HD-GYP domain-containing protein (c-di-GMP phosphodiesterase class II)